MRALRHSDTGIPLFLRAALVLYMVGAVLLVTVHQHQDGLPHHDCALCSAAHTPAVVSMVAVQIAPPVLSAASPVLQAERVVESESPRNNSTRAPPLV